MTKIKIGAILGIVGAGLALLVNIILAFTLNTYFGMPATLGYYYDGLDVAIIALSITVLAIKKNNKHLKGLVVAATILALVLGILEVKNIFGQFAGVTLLVSVILSFIGLFEINKNSNQISEVNENENIGFTTTTKESGKATSNINANAKTTSTSKQPQNEYDAKLLRLKQAKEDGIISDADYEKKLKELMEEEAKKI
jgi:FtsH-binding integral membrane protein